jgi:hypothetical protein
MDENQVKQEVDQAVDQVKDYYDTAEAKVDGFFAKNKYTVVILTGVAVTLVVLFFAAVFK